MTFSTNIYTFLMLYNFKLPDIDRSSYRCNGPILNLVLNKLGEYQTYFSSRGGYLRLTGVSDWIQSQSKSVILISDFQRIWAKFIRMIEETQYSSSAFPVHSFDIEPNKNGLRNMEGNAINNLPISVLFGTRSDIWITKRESNSLTTVCKPTLLTVTSPKVLK